MTLPEHPLDWSLDWWTWFQERAAIMQYDGGLSRAEAERAAVERTRLLAERDPNFFGEEPAEASA